MIVLFLNLFQITKTICTVDFLLSYPRILFSVLWFDQGFNFTYFFGSNASLIGIANLIGVDVERSTYVFRLSEYGIDPTVQWHSALFVVGK
jgi:hypothetical protein